MMLMFILITHLLWILFLCAAGAFVVWFLYALYWWSKE